MRFASARHAGVAVAALEVDAELQPDKAFKFYAVEGDEVVVCVARAHHRDWLPTRSPISLHSPICPPCCRNFYATEARVLRVMVSTVYDMLGVTARMLREFS